MSIGDNAAVARAWAQAAWQQHDLDAAAKFLASDWIGHHAGLGEAHGWDGFKRVGGAFLTAFPDMQIKLAESLAVDDKLVRRVNWTATHTRTFLGIPATGRSVAVRETIILRVTDGKIAEEWEAGDLLGLLQQLGAVPRFELDPARSR